MGVKLVKQMILYAVDVPLSQNEYRLLLNMALTAMDADDPPRYFDSREASALAIGRRVADEVPGQPDPERAAAFEAVKVATRGLVNLKAIERLRTGHRGQRAEYVVRLDPVLTRQTDEWQKRKARPSTKPPPPKRRPDGEKGRSSLLA